MLALVLKDLYMLQKQFKLIGVMLAFFMFMAFVLDNGIFLITLILIFATLQVTTAFTFDEMSDWDKFAGTLPVSKKQIVQSRYVLGVVLSVGGLLIVTPIMIVSNVITFNLPIYQVGAILTVVISFALVIIAILLPLYIKFGSQKARIIMFVLFFTPTILGGTMAGAFESVKADLPPVDTLALYSYGLPILALCIVYISFKISVRWYEKKQF